MNSSFPGMSQVSYSSYSTRYESYSSRSGQALDQNPVHTESEKVEQSEKVSRADSFDVDALVNQIWGFASNRIAQAQADGASEAELESMWAAAEKGVEQGFGEAHDVLESLGELDEPLEMKINSAYGQIMDKLAERSLEPVNSGNVQSADGDAKPATQTAPVDRYIALEQYERQDFALNLTTAEGDQILIRSVTSDQANAEDLRFGNMSSTQWSRFQSSEYSLIIKGDLNEQEAADLDALLAEVNTLAEEFYEGDHETAFQMAQELSIDGTTLKSLDLSMTETEQKKASVYSEVSGQFGSLPKGLQPLREYADKLIAAQQKWQDHFNSPKDFLHTLSNHPMNRGALESTARHLLW